MFLHILLLLFAAGIYSSNKKESIPFESTIEFNLLGNQRIGWHIGG